MPPTKYLNDQIQKFQISSFPINHFKLINLYSHVNHSTTVNSEFEQVQSNRTYKELRHSLEPTCYKLNKILKIDEILKRKSSRNENVRPRLNGQLSANNKIENDSYNLFKQISSILLVLSVLLSPTTAAAAQLTNHQLNNSSSSLYKPNHQLNNSSSSLYRPNHLINLFLNNNGFNSSSNNRNVIDYRNQFIGSRPLYSYPLSNLVKNVPLHSISTDNNDHNFNSLLDNRPNQSVLPFKQPLNFRKSRSVASKVFNQSVDNHEIKLNQTMPIDNLVNQTALSPPSFDRSSFLNLDNTSLIFTPQPLVSSQNDSSSTGPDQIYIDVLKNTRFWVQRIGKFVD